MTYPMVIVPVFNAQNCLEGTLNEIYKLGYLDWCIFIDDGSTDKTSEILKVWEPYIGRTFYIAKNGRKIGSIFNIMELMNLEGTLPKYTILSDGDTFFHNHSSTEALERALERAIKFMETNGYKATALKDVPLNDEGSPQNNTLLQKLQYWEYLSDRAIHVILGKKGFLRCICGAGGVYDSQVLLEALKYHSLRHDGDDMETTALIQKLGCKVGYFNEDLEARTQVPRTWKSLIKQRIRWTVGAIDTYIKERGFYGKRMIKHDRWSLQMIYETVKLITYAGWYVALFFYPVQVILIGYAGTYALSEALLLANPESKGERRKGTLMMIPTAGMIYVLDIIRIPIACAKSIWKEIIGWETRDKLYKAKCPNCNKITFYKKWLKKENGEHLKIINAADTLTCKNKKCLLLCHLTIPRS